MLASVKLQKRQSQVRESLATLSAIETPTEDQLNEMRSLDAEYSANETRYRAALISEDEERREAGEELETRSEKEYAELVDNFELRQVALALDEGHQITGQTAEVVQEMRQQGGYQGIPVPLAALEIRAGETVAAGTPDPRTTKTLIDRLFPQSVAGKLKGQMININSGEIEYPVATQGATASWATTETGDVGAAVEYQTVDKVLKPDHNLGCQMVLTRKTMKQSGGALEQAVRRDMNAAIGIALDKAIFLGSGASGEPLGLIPGAATYGFTVETVDAAATYAVFRNEATKFLTRNAAGAYSNINLLMRTELLDQLDDALYTGTAVSELDRLAAKLGSIVTTNNALDAPAGSPLESSAVMTVNTGGVAPFYVGIWGGVDLIRDPFTKAASGQLALTGLVTADVTASRSEQVTILNELQ